MKVFFLKNRKTAEIVISPFVALVLLVATDVVVKFNLFLFFSEMEIASFAQSTVKVFR
jgi:hypothetical protein